VAEFGLRNDMRVGPFCLTSEKLRALVRVTLD
jgi:hypothetical protein